MGEQEFLSYKSRLRFHSEFTVCEECKITFYLMLKRPTLSAVALCTNHV